MNHLKINFGGVRPHSNSAKIIYSLGKYGDPSRCYLKKRTIKQGVSRLKKLGLVSIKEGSNHFNLTEAGILHYLKLCLSQADLLPEQYVCVVVFDIPERLRIIRLLLSKFLEESCFLRIQKSVWISQFDCAEILTEMFKRLGIKGMIRIFIAREV